MGVWYLDYWEFDSIENVCSLARRQKGVNLRATNEEDALKEATEEWHKRLAKGTYRGWDGHTYPNQPKLVYRSSLDIK